MTVTTDTEPTAQDPTPDGDTDSTGPRRTRLRRKPVIVSAVLVAALAAGTLAVLQPWHGGFTRTGHATGHHTTAEVQRTSLADGLKLAGQLSYGTPTDVVPQGHGVLTALPKEGDRIKAGRRLYEVDGAPVVLFTGDRPLWRDLTAGMSEGEDVRELKRNLVDLGYADGLGLSVDEKFTKSTVTAVERWQKAAGLQQTGKVTLGSVVVLPSATVRVQQVPARLGATVGASAVLKVTGTDLVAQLQPSDDQVSQFQPGGKVTVQLADGTRLPGTIRTLSLGGSGNQQGNGGGGESGGGGDTSKTTVTIALDSQKQAAKAGPSSVTVTVTGQSVDDALVVPVTALLALDGGGYGVQVVSGSRTRLVRVQLGLVANAKAQITGEIKAGDQVVIPS
ncbi:peptidoglycan-binding domain-containing protein [Streptomyces sp. WZ-12]|uniref:peptidoglycan-binding domain-containing protein n=1 Tax=Streptomyces sp. WZ-12 TaxID=3030210 RepID=UPI0023818FC3|nr:peptidoglycan-binding domain-containing protein [Streptomyces sp. WZ-12]